MASMRYEFNPKTRKLIKNRDKHQCINCGSTFWLTIAHVFVSRAHGGLGVEQNGVVLCQSCHHTLDNGRDGKKSQLVKETCEAYLKERYGRIERADVTFNKWKGYEYE